MTPFMDSDYRLLQLREKVVTRAEVKHRKRAWIGILLLDAALWVVIIYGIVRAVDGLR
jgi:hypothetical protein